MMTSHTRRYFDQVHNQAHPPSIIYILGVLPEKARLDADGVIKVNIRETCILLSIDFQSGPPAPDLVVALLLGRRLHHGSPVALAWQSEFRRHLPAEGASAE